jgi:hypothetical protein
MVNQQQSSYKNVNADTGSNPASAIALQAKAKCKCPATIFRYLVQIRFPLQTKQILQDGFAFLCTVSAFLDRGARIFLTSHCINMDYYI